MEQLLKTRLSRSDQPRYEFHASCTLTMANGGQLSGEAKNISLGGIFLKLNKPDSVCTLQQVGQAEIIACLNEERFRVSIQCRILHLCENGIGIQFTPAKEEPLADLNRLLEALSQYNAYFSRERNRLLEAKYRITAFFYDILDYPWEREYRGWRPTLLKDVHSKVLEMGVGTGRNFEHYPASVQLTGIDLSDQMLQRAAQRSKSADCVINLYKEDATIMASIPSSHYDWLISFFLCCVMPNKLQPLAIQQVERILKPGGRFRLLEMVYSQNPKLRKRQEFFAPFVEKVYGARFDRNTLEYLRRSQQLEITNTYFIKEDTYLIIEGRRKPVD